MDGLSACLCIIDDPDLHWDSYMVGISNRRAIAVVESDIYKKFTTRAFASGVIFVS